MSRRPPFSAGRRDGGTEGREDGETGELEAIAAIGEAAAAGDPHARAVVAETARWLGVAIGNLVNALNPAVVVLGGPTAEWGAILIDGIEAELARRTLPQARRAVRVVVGEARDLAAPLGAAALVLQRAGEFLNEARGESREARGERTSEGGS